MGPGPGRHKGVPNKITGEFRDTVKRLLEDNSENVGAWLGSVAQDDPAKALDPLALREWVRHAKEEALDLAVYLTKIEAKLQAMEDDGK